MYRRERCEAQSSGGARKRAELCNGRLEIE